MDADAGTLFWDSQSASLASLSPASNGEIGLTVTLPSLSECLSV